MNQAELTQAIIDLGRVVVTLENATGIRKSMRERDIAAVKRIMDDYATQLNELIADEADEYLDELDLSVAGTDLAIRIKLVDTLDERP